MKINNLLVLMELAVIDALQVIFEYGMYSVDI